MARLLRILDSSDEGVVRLRHEVERFDFRLSAQDYVAVLGQDIEPPLAWDIRVARFNDAYNDLLNSGLIESTKDALLGHSVTGTGAKIRVNAARKQNAFSFMIDGEQAYELPGLAESPDSGKHGETHMVRFRWGGGRFAAATPWKVYDVYSFLIGFRSPETWPKSSVFCTMCVSPGVPRFRGPTSPGKS